MKRYEIFDQDADGSLDFDLKRVLSCLPEYAHFSLWRLLELEAVGPDVLAIEAEVTKSSGGITLSWSVLLALADSFEQVINLRLAASRPVERSSRQEVLVLEVLDSTLWAIETNLDAVESWLRSSFRDVRVAQSVSV